MEGFIRGGSRDWIVEMVGSKGDFVITWEEFGNDCNANFLDYDRACRFARWLAQDGITTVTLQGTFDE